MSICSEINQIEEIKNGYHLGSGGEYHCSVCGKEFSAGEIFQIEERFFDHHKAIQMHMQTKHQDYFCTLLEQESRYNTFTNNQKRLLELFHQGLPDKEIASRLGVSASTVRHQKFVFREKAKQAKLYLAIYSLALERSDYDELVPLHDKAKMVDERYVVTKDENQQHLDFFFESIEPLRLKSFPAKEKKKIVVLAKIAQQFVGGEQYSEQQVNDILSAIFSDYATLRRYLIEYGFLNREKDGSKYWRT